MTDTETRSGFVAVVGRPNVGKSTLVNALVGDKVAITSPRPQTTRNTIRGVLTDEAEGFQIVLVDTPGLHKPKTALGRRLNALVEASLADADAIMFVIDATQPVGPGDRLIAERLIAAGTPAIVVVNKVDRADREQIAQRLTEAAEWGFGAYVPVSALKQDGTAIIVDELAERLGPGPFFFPTDAVTDQPDRFTAGELIREKYLSRLHDELPHALAVVVDDMEQRPDGLLEIVATAYVERESQKGMVIGKGGTMVRDVGTAARSDLERLFGTRVFLDLRVKVARDWQETDAMLDRLGF
ncbi:MAG: GTPase Era [Acidimicrobiia bacterium]